MATICPITNEKCPYNKQLINGICEDQLTCPVVDTSFRKLKKKKKVVINKKVILISFYLFLILLLGVFTYIYFFTNIIIVPNNNIAVSVTPSTPIPTPTSSDSNDTGLVVYINNNLNTNDTYKKVSLPDIPTTNKAATCVKRIRIDSLSIYAEIINVRLNKYNLIETYPSKNIVSWYEDSALPGKLGNCILLGNKYYNNFTAVFNNLDKINIDDEIVFTLDNGKKITQKVYDITYYKGDILPEIVLDLDTSFTVSTLISRAGQYNSETGDFDSFIVVKAH